MRKIISLILVLVMVFASSALAFAGESAENAISETRRKSTRYFYDDFGNYYQVVGQTKALGYYGYARTTGSVFSFAGGDPGMYNNNNITVSGGAGTTVAFSDGYTTANTWTLSDTFSFSSPDPWGQYENDNTFSAPVLSVTCSHTMSTNHGGSVSFVTLALTQ